MRPSSAVIGRALATLSVCAGTVVFVPGAAPGASGAPRVPEIVAGAVSEVDTGLASGSESAIVNLTMVDGRAPGYITADVCSRTQAGAQTVSTGNHGRLDAVAQLAVVAVDGTGRFCIANQREVGIAVDVQGAFAPGGLRLTSSPPQRALDTRLGGARVAAGTITKVEHAAPPGAAAVLVNLTAVEGLTPGYVTADRCDSLQPGPQTRSSVNHLAGPATSNLAVVAVDTGGAFCLYNQAAVHLVADVQGSFSTSGDNGFASITPTRLVDTRDTPAAPVAGEIIRVETGRAGAPAALVSIAMTDASVPGFVTADRCSTLEPGPQSSSAGNHLVGVATSSLAAVPLDADGALCIFTSAPVELAVDLHGVFTPTSTSGLVPVTPRRVFDERPPPLPTTPATSCSSVVHIGDSTSVGMISPTYLPDPNKRIDAQYRRVGVSNPRMEISGARSIVETLRGQINAYDVARNLKAAGYEGCWVLALGTTDTANIAAGSGPGRRVRIDKMMSVIGDDPVMWVNVRTAVTGNDPWSNTNMQLWNQALSAAAPSYPNLRIYDWSSAMSTSWLSGDRVHYTTDGYAIRARMIADALAALWPA